MAQLLAYACNVSAVNDGYRRKAMTKFMWVQSLYRCVPREAPPLDYYGMMNELKVIREDLDVLAQMAAATGLMDSVAVETELRKLRKVSEEIGMAVAGEYDEDD